MKNKAKTNDSKRECQMLRITIFSAVLTLFLACSGENPDRTACLKDSDCKGNRICQSKTCIEQNQSQNPDGGGGSDNYQSIEKENPQPEKTNPKCNGNWSLGSTFYTDSSAGIGHECSKGFKNCRDGSFIQFPDGRCVCLLKCSSLVNAKLGKNCTKSGIWKCRHIQATNDDKNQGKVCVKDEWNLCQAGGTQPGTNPPQNPGKTCKDIGAACSDDEECCSDSCDEVCEE